MLGLQILIVHHFDQTPSNVNVRIPAGSWPTVLDSNEERWGGGGGSTSGGTSVKWRSGAFIKPLGISRSRARHEGQRIAAFNRQGSYLRQDLPELIHADGRLFSLCLPRGLAISES